jgi:hypothetical protein
MMCEPLELKPEKFGVAAIALKSTSQAYWS